MALDFSSLVKSVGRTLLPKSLEEPFGVAKPKPFEFRVGEGLTPQQKRTAEAVVRKVDSSALRKQKPRSALSFLPEATKELAIDIGQSTARNIGSAGLTLAGAVNKNVEPFELTQIKSTFGQELARLVFGVNEGDQIKSIERRIADAEPKIKEWGKKQGGTLGDVARSYPTSLAFIGVMGSVGLDLTPFGSLEKNVFRVLKQTDNVGDAITVLGKMGVSDDLARFFADDVVKVADDRAAKALLIHIADVKKRTVGALDATAIKAVGDVPVPLKTTPAVKTFDDSLILEARKYKSDEKDALYINKQGEFLGKEGFSHQQFNDLLLGRKEGIGSNELAKTGNFVEVASFLDRKELNVRIYGEITEQQQNAIKKLMDGKDNIFVDLYSLNDLTKPIKSFTNPTKSQLTDIWEKTRGMVDEVSSTVIHLPEKNIYARLDKKTADILRNEVENVQVSKDDIVHLSQVGRVKGKAEEVSLDKIRALSRNADESLKNVSTKGEATTLVETPKQTKPATTAQIDAGNKDAGKTLEDVVAYSKDNVQETIVNNEVAKAVIKKDMTNTVKQAVIPPKVEGEDLITTRKFKQTDEWKDFAKYAEDNLQDKDINPAVLFRHTTMTMERVAEFLDGGIGGRTYREIVKPVYDSAQKMKLEGAKIKGEFDSFRILEGSVDDKAASLFAQKKLSDASKKAKEVAAYTRNKYDEFLERLNKTRAKVGVEEIPKRQDYITHLNELNVLSELFGGLERVTIKKRISNLKSELLDLHPDWTDARAFDAAKREIEGLTGIAQYVDARQPIFKFAKKRLGEYEKNPSITRSFNVYSQNALRYIYQAENVARNKAFKDVLPANAREFTRLWNTEQVAGRQAPSFLSPVARRALSAVRGTLGANTILGNMATTMMQLTSWPQVVALAGVRNTFYGLGSRLRTYIPGLTNQFDVSRTKNLRNLNIDIGLGDSLIDKTLVKVGEYEALRNSAARTRKAIDVGRNLLMSIMETADKFTVGATYQAFYRKGVLDGLSPQDAMEFADIMTGKTQANYFKEALPPFLNTIEGKTLGQFGTYGMNQWEMFKRDFGKSFRLNEKNPRSVARVFKQFMVFLSTAYIVDTVSEETFGRQPYDVKELVDDSVGFIKGDLTGGQLFDSAKDTVATYIPFMGSVKFGSMPPVAEFGKDVANAILGTGKAQEDAIANLSEKWIYNVLMPYGGNQARKSLQGIEAATDTDLPFVRNVSKDIDIETNIDKAKAILFGPYATEEAIRYFENRDRREGIKEKFKITGTITSDENIEKLRKMTPEEFELYTSSYAESTLKTINRKLGESERPKLDSIFNNERPSLNNIFAPTP